MSKPRRDPAATHRQWTERLDRFRRSGHTVAQFCAAEGVSEPSFYVWKRTLAGVAPPPTVVPIHITPSSPSPAAIELSLPSGAVVRFPADARPEMIVAVLRGLEERPC